MTPSVRVFVVVALVIVGVDVVGATDYETPRNRSLKDVLPVALAAGPNFTLLEPVQADGYMYHFKVKRPASTATSRFG